MACAKLVYVLFSFAFVADALFPQTLRAFTDYRNAHAREAAASLLETGVAHEHRAAAATGLPKEAGWFGGFDQTESTYTDEAVNAELERSGEIQDHGVNAGITPPTRGFAPKAEWYAETPSGGGNAAWQTFYPPMTSSVSGNRDARVGHWRQTPEGMVQDYEPATKANMHQPQFFDASVLSYDGFGRRTLPDAGTARRNLATDAGGAFQERAVNTSIACAAKGCSASSTLTAFSGAGEEAHNCKLSIFVHPTDLDNSFGNEGIDYWKANGVQLRGACHPDAMGCNDSAWRPLYPCVRSMDVDHLLGKTGGSLSLEGKISSSVDECAYNGNLLSAVAMVTCQVRPKTAMVVLNDSTAAWDGLRNSLLRAGASDAFAGDVVDHLTSLGVDQSKAALFALAIDQRPAGVSVYDLCTAAALPGQENLPANLMLLRLLTYGAEVSDNLSCAARGCQASKYVHVDPLVALMGGTCALNVSLKQTDFDDAASETVEYVRLAGSNVSTNIQPGLNPCTAQYSGSPVPADQLTYSVASGMNVSGLVVSSGTGSLLLEAKISEGVDECGSAAGALLDMSVSIHCELPRSRQFSTA